MSVIINIRQNSTSLLHTVNICKYSILVGKSPLDRLCLLSCNFLSFVEAAIEDGVLLCL